MAKAPAYMLTDPQWARLFDLYMGVMIVVMHSKTMRVLARKGLCKRRAEYTRWEITDAGLSALRTSAPIWARIAPAFSSLTREKP